MSNDDKRWTNIMKKDYIFSESDENVENQSDDSAAQSESEMMGRGQVNGDAKPAIFGLTHKKRPISDYMAQFAPNPKKLKLTEEPICDLTKPSTSQISIKERSLKKNSRHLLTGLWTLIDTATSGENIRWLPDPQPDGRQSFIIFDKAFFDLDRWTRSLPSQRSKKAAEPTLKSFINRLRRFFDIVEEGERVTFTSHVDIIFASNEPFGKGEIFDTGYDVRRKEELNSKSTIELIDIILDHEQSINERDLDIQNLRRDLEDTELMNRTKLESLEENNQRLQKLLGPDGERKEEPKQELKQEPSSTVSDSCSLEDALSQLRLSLTDKAEKYLRNDFGLLSSIPLEIWPDMLEEWLLNGSSSNSPDAFHGLNKSLGFRDIMVFRHLQTLGREKRKTLLKEC